ncbi:MAG: NAD(+)/NADH kinase [Ruminococcus sp.]|nr:NAD(+)/NADH kinase [Ruminococcus sp.]
MNIAVIVNTGKKAAIDCAGRISEMFISAGVKIIMPSKCEPYYKNLEIEYVSDHFKLFESCDLAVTVGGDGTIIHSAKHAAAYDKPMIGVNVGRLGFAAEVEPDHIDDLKRLLSGDYNIQKRMLLSVSVRRKDKSVDEFIAVNEATLARGQMSRIIDISISLNRSPITTYRADGVLFSTPTGSTAYALSAGGPVISPEMQCVLLTPVCPHSLISRSVIFESDALLTAKVRVSDGTNPILSIDGEKNIEITPDDLVIIKKSDKTLKLITLYERNFYQLLNEKLKERKS